MELQNSCYICQLLPQCIQHPMHWLWGLKGAHLMAQETLLTLIIVFEIYWNPLKLLYCTLWSLLSMFCGLPTFLHVLFLKQLKIYIQWPPILFYISRHAWRMNERKQQQTKINKLFGNLNVDNTATKLYKNAKINTNTKCISTPNLSQSHESWRKMLPKSLRFS